MWTKAHRARHDARLKSMVPFGAVGQMARWLERADPPRSGQARCNHHGVRRRVVERGPDQRGFVVLERRWVVERSFAHAGRCRRLARGHEATPASALGFFVPASAMLLVRRWAGEL